jgi:hypothetical protein
MDDAATPKAPTPPTPPLLPFDDPWSLRTRPTTFEGVVTAGEVVSLNHIRCGGLAATHAYERGAVGLA